jgi:hypothetical protein
MDLSKSLDFFNPSKVTERVHIIGCGSVGSSVAELLVRFGLTRLTLYDSDQVQRHNIANQAYTVNQVGMRKTEALKDLLKSINPDVDTHLIMKTNWDDTVRISGYIFMCVDTVEVRRDIVTSCKDNPYIRAIFDFRTRLTDAQHYAASWCDDLDSLLMSMQFSHEDAELETPISACGIALSAAPVVRSICSLGVMNFLGLVNTGKLKKFIQIDTSSWLLDAL